MHINALNAKLAKKHQKPFIFPINDPFFLSLYNKNTNNNQYTHLYEIQKTLYGGSITLWTTRLRRNPKLRF